MTLPPGALQELDSQRIDARYTFRIRVLYVLSFVIPCLALLFFNAPAFRAAWADKTVYERVGRSRLTPR